ncbi:unnamed protein product [Blepharisma stoltei]|uniref:Rubisco LSMT substrate-binding domain-containing protein n=1 Tax=Blepharisma stoltei TaxID=1481888 RepID=A0AAU9JIZ3_9CILI|nr:unnamed protein product [Blepharisma stoltei]
METKPKIKGGGGALERKDLTVQRDPSVNQAVTQEVQSDNRYLRYYNWLISNGCIFPSLEFPVAFTDAGIVGALAKIDITPCKAFLFIPYSITINLFKARKSEIAHIFQEHNYWFQTHPRGDDHIMWTYIIYEKLKGAESFWFPYFETIKSMESVIDWDETEILELQDPVLVYECKQWSKRIENTWKSMEEILLEHPNYFPPDKDLKGLFNWAWRLTCTRAFAWEGGMVIPLADNLNHSDCYITYESEYREILEQTHLTIEGNKDYRDFSNTAYKGREDTILRSNTNRLEKYLENNKNKDVLKELDAIWQVEEIIADYRSSSDEEDARNIGEVFSDEEKEEADEGYESDDDTEEFKDNTNSRDEPDSYFIMSTGVRTFFKQGSQVYNSYGRLNNRDLLLDYGFVIEKNRYDAVYFRMWIPSSGKTGYVTAEDIINEAYKFDLSCANLDDVTELHEIKLKRFSTDIFTYFRKIADYTCPALQNVDPPSLKASPTNIKLELWICDQVYELYTRLESTFSTPLEHDVSLLNSNLPSRLRMAIIYRIAQKRILINQKHMLNKLKSILEATLNGDALENHLKEKTIKELREVYPLNGYLKSLKANRYYSR